VIDEGRQLECAKDLVLYRLSRLGVDAGALRAGPHLLARRTGRPVTIQLNVVESGSRTGRTCEWLIDEVFSADLVALVDLSSERVWLMTPYEVGELSKLGEDGKRRLYTYADPTLDLEKTGHIVFSGDFERYALERQHERIA